MLQRHGMGGARWITVEKVIRSTAAKMTERHGYLHYPRSEPYPFDHEHGWPVAICVYGKNDFEKAGQYDQTPLRLDVEPGPNSAQIVENYADFVVRRVKDYWDEAYPEAEAEQGSAHDLGSFAKAPEPVFVCSRSGSFAYLTGTKWQWKSGVRAVGVAKPFVDDATAAMATVLRWPKLRKPDLYGD